MKIFLDDIRMPQDCLGYMYKRIGNYNLLYKEEWIIVRNYNEFIRMIQNNIDEITHVSFDHDLADEHYTTDMYVGAEKYNENKFTEKTGYDCAKWLKEYYEQQNKDLPIMFIHSMNPVGTQNIINVFKK